MRCAFCGSVKPGEAITPRKGRIAGIAPSERETEGTRSDGLVDA